MLFKKTKLNIFSKQEVSFNFMICLRVDFNDEKPHLLVNAMNNRFHGFQLL